MSNSFFREFQITKKMQVCPFQSYSLIPYTSKSLHSMKEIELTWEILIAVNIFHFIELLALRVPAHYHSHSCVLGHFLPVA